MWKFTNDDRHVLPLLGGIGIYTSLREFEKHAISGPKFRFPEPDAPNKLANFQARTPPFPSPREARAGRGTGRGVQSANLCRYQCLGGEGRGEGERKH